MSDSYNYSLGCKTAGRWLHLRCQSCRGNLWLVATWLSVLHAWETGDRWRFGFQFCMHGKLVIGGDLVFNFACIGNW